jgi:hypothetical protein
MKTKITYSLLAAAAACSLVNAQTTAYTTPVGYVTQSLAPSKYTLVSVTTHNPDVAAGVLDAESASPKSVTDNEVNFTTTLTAGAIYILELPDGTIQEISSWSGSVLTTPDDITAVVSPGSTSYKLRKASTVADVFGADNTFGLKFDADENPYNNDLILVPNATNAFDTVYFFNDGETIGWFDDQGNEANNKVLNYGDGFFVQRQAGPSSIDLTITGEVKKVPTKGVLFAGYNFMGAVSPVGLNLGNSGLQDFLTIATNETQAATTADFVLQQQPNGTYRTAYFFNDGETVGWFDDQGNTADDMILDTGYLIQNKGSAKPVKISVPAHYPNL